MNVVIGPSAPRGGTSVASPTDAPEWVVCLGSGRPIVDGLVWCPRGLYTALSRCLLCPHLEATHDERQPGHSCLVGEARLDETTREEAAVSWGELVVELL